MHAGKGTDGAFQGVDVVPVDVQVQITPGNARLSPWSACPTRRSAKAASGCARRSCALGLALPPQRIIVNLAPADLAKEGSHYDLPIALGADGRDGRAAARRARGYAALGELALDGALAPGGRASLPAAIARRGAASASSARAACGGEAAWAGERCESWRRDRCSRLINHFTGTQMLTPPEPRSPTTAASYPDLARHQGPRDGQAGARDRRGRRPQPADDRPAGLGQVDAGARLPGLLPPLEPAEALEVCMIHSVAGLLADGRSSGAARSATRTIRPRWRRWSAAA